MLFKKPGGVSWLVVFLGNPGLRYEGTRHNAGFMAGDAMARARNTEINRARFKALTGVCEIGGQSVLLMKPQTYMNLSGDAVREAAQFYKIPADHVLVIYDDVSLPVGKLRVRPSGSAGGHNGIKSIIANLGTDVFPRIKIGTGAPPGGGEGMVDWVIGEPSQGDKKLLLDAFSRAIAAAKCIVEHDGDCQQAMNDFN